LIVPLEEILKGGGLVCVILVIPVRSSNWGDSRTVKLICKDPGPREDGVVIIVFAVAAVVDLL